MFEKENKLEICKTIHNNFFGAWGFLLIGENIDLVSHCHVKKIAVKFVIFFFNKYINIFLLLIFMFFS